MNVLLCPACGERATDVNVVAGPALRCGTCAGTWPFARLPLLCVTGPSGAGKSAIARLLVGSLAQRFVVLEQDVLWQAGLWNESPDNRMFRAAWLRMAAMIHQNGRPVVLCGTVVPPEFEPLPERRLFSSISYVALTCDPQVLRARLRQRPAWREWDEARIAETVDYAMWMSERAHMMDPPMTLLDTTGATVEETADRVRMWALEEGSAHNGRPARSLEG